MALVTFKSHKILNTNKTTYPFILKKCVIITCQLAGSVRIIHKLLNKELFQK